MRNLLLVAERRRSVDLKDVITNLNNSKEGKNSNDNRRVADLCQIGGGGGGDIMTVDSSTFVLTNDGILVKLIMNTSASSSDQQQEQQQQHENSIIIEWVVELDTLCEKPGGEWFCLQQVENNSNTEPLDSGVTATADHVILVCLSKNGAIVTISPSTGQAELVGEFDHGIQAGCFSPDKEVLCLLTFEEEEEEDDDDKQQTTGGGGSGGKMNSALLLMNTQWEVLAETTIESHIPCSSSSSSEEEETTTKTKQQQIDSSASQVSMCWRPDGSLVAISTVDVNDKMRKIRIYKRDNLQFHAIGRLEDGSGKLVPNIIGGSSMLLHWAGVGCSQLLASVQRKGKKTIQVIFFEPNGNRHREFPLRTTSKATTTTTTTTTKVLGLTWNNESDLLAVTLREEEEGQEGSSSSSSSSCDKVQLWHRSNYHWYMKQEFRFERNNRVSKVVFHEEKSHLLYVFFQDRCAWREYEVLWQPSSIQILTTTTTTTTTTATNHHHTTASTCLAYVVDGCSLNMTALDQALVPPPMSAYSITMDNPISTIIPARDGGGGGGTKSIIALIVLSDGSIVLLGNPLLENTTTTTTTTTTDNNNISRRQRQRRRFTTPRVVAKGSLKDLEGIVDHTALRSMTFVEQTDTFIRLLAVCAAPVNGYKESLLTLSVTWDEDNGTATVTISNRPNNDNESPTIPLDQRVLCCAPWSDSNGGALLELENGTLLEFNDDVDVTSSSYCLRPLEGHEFMEPCSWIAGIKDPSSSLSSSTVDMNNNTTHSHHNNSYHDRQKELIFGLSLRSRLFYHDVLLADAVSSFFVSMSHQYLCYAAADGSTSQLRFLPLSDLQHFDTLMGSDSNVILEGYEPRSVERGACLVAVLPGSPTSILQMPRGNLEGIYPRALILRFVMNKIASGEYGVAFTMMRRQKVNLNLIVDLNPRKFLEEGVSTFLQQVATIDHLNLFISCLQNWDSTQHQYQIPPWLHLISERDADIKKLFDFPTKINQVCSKLRSIMMEAEKNGQLEGGKAIPEGHFLLPILTTFAREDPPKLEEALTLIKDNAIAKSRQSTSSVKKPPLFSDAAQSSIQYLAFLADHELIFNVGLGLYDFDVARACARNSQMDPKVYLPLLKRLRSLPTYYARFEVDMRLKRYDEALRNLFESSRQEESLEGVEPLQDNKVDMPTSDSVGNDFQSCMALIEKHQLHGTGLELFQSDYSKKRLVLVSLGEKLLREGKASSALTIFLTIEPVDIDQAKKAARACKNWQCYFTLMDGSSTEENGDDSDERDSVAREISEAIAMASEGHYNMRGDLCEAARILLDYCSDVDSAVEVLIKGWAWREGCRVATLHDRPDLVQRCAEAAVSFAEMTMGDLEERKETFLEKTKRYEEVLEIRKEAIRSGEADDLQMPPDDDSGSVFSAASNASNMSLQSTASTGSLSSVISIRSNTSFSITGREAETRHFSKWGSNNSGKNAKQKKKKKKKNRPGKNKIRPGSPEELQSLVDLLKGSCIDKDYGAVISTTIEFLAQTGRALDTARDLYRCYVGMSEAVRDCYVKRAEAVKNARLADVSRLPVTLPCEEVVDKLSNEPLPDSLAEVFSLLL